jgi:outer membrane receptor protein involved in Fe transport
MQAFTRYAVATLAWCVSLEVAAQAGASARAAEGAVLEEVVVTGSRIKRKDLTSISPLVTLDAERITLSGITAVEDLVNDAPQLVPSFNRASNNPGANAAGLDLRGLGSNRTLVALNGRRMAPADEFGAVDINIIPAQLLKRVEIVTGGASSVYGSDAMAGVVNFILDDEFEGLEITAQYDTYQEGDGDTADLSAIFGFGNDRGHITGFVNYQDREPVFAGDRPFSFERLQENFGPPNPGELVPAGSSITVPGSVVFPLVPLPGTGGPPVSVTFNEDGSPRAFVRGQDQYNFQPINYLQTPLRRNAAALFGRYQLTDRVEAFAELLYAQTEANSQLAPPPAFVEAVVNLDNPLLTDSQRELFGSAYDFLGDGNARFVYSRRLDETGPRRLSREAESLRAVLGLRGELSERWDWELSVSSSDVRGDNIVGNSVFADRFTQGLLVDPATGACVDPSNGCVPFNPFGLTIPEEAAEFLRAGDIVSAYSVDEDIVNFAVTGDWLELPAGPIGLAAGVEWRELSAENDADDRFAGGGVLGYNARADTRGSTDVAEVFVEALVPLLAGAPFADYLGVEAGYRYSDYKYSGNVNNWKAGSDWSPLPSVRFRVMLQQAVRAPNIDELFSEAREQPTALFEPSEDFCSASADPVGNGLTDLCVSQGIPAGQVGVYEAQDGFPLTLFADGGSTDLEPETADTFTAGIVFQPERLEDFSLSVDYYRIQIDNAIGSTDFSNSLSLCARSRDPGSQFCSPVVRGPSGDITQYTNALFNLAELAVEGVDISLNYQMDLWDGLALPGHSASLSLQVLFNHAIENSSQSTPDSPSIDCAGYYGGACRFAVSLFSVVPENRGSTRLTYYSGPLSVALNWRWIGGISNHIDITCEQTPEFCYPTVLGDVDARNYLELSGRYEFGEKVEIYGGVSNLTEEDPPLLGIGASQSNTAPQLYDVFGRRFFVGMRYRL